MAADQLIQDTEVPVPRQAAYDTNVPLKRR